jgi:hypothetical protein
VADVAVGPDEIVGRLPHTQPRTACSPARIETAP